MAWDKGTHLQGGRYVIEKELGRGGSGITYIASRTDNGQSVAIKTVNEMVQGSSQFAKYQQVFENEARRLQQCRHRHIVSVHQLFQEGQLWCMVMEYIPGETFKDYVEKRGVLSETEALQYIRQIGEALIEVHNNNLLHRDVKPSNIMLCSDRSQAVLIDFGSAREFISEKTQSHTVEYSDGYAPIEQYITKRKRGAYTDVYATAATLYFMVTGRVPLTAWDRSDGEQLVPPKQLNWRISDRVNEAILKGMALEYRDRPQSMQEWLKLLEPQVITPPTVEPAHKVEVIRPSSLPVPTAQPSELDISPDFSPHVEKPTRNLREIYKNKYPAPPSLKEKGENLKPLSLQERGLERGFPAPVKSEDTSLPTAQPSEPDSDSLIESLIKVFIVYVVAGLFLAYRSAPLWGFVIGSVAVAGVVAGAGAVAGVVAMGVMVVAVAMAGGGPGAVVMAIMALSRDGAGAVAKPKAVAMAVVMAVLVLGGVAEVRKSLLESFSRFHTFLILVVTSELGLAVGWLVYLMILSKR